MTTVSVPLADPRRGYRAYRAEIDAAVLGALDGNAYITGPRVAAFEQAFSRWFGVNHTVSVANGTDAVELALRTLGVGAGDLVFTVSHTAVATVAAIELAGATPVLIDVDPKTYTLDPQKLADTLASYAKSHASGRPRAVIGVHLYGQPCDMAALLSICASRDLYLIEDCAQAHGTIVNGKSVGAQGVAAAFSFYPTKNLPAFGDGGAVSFGSAELATRCRELREYGWRSRYVSAIGGMNSRLDELQAAILEVRLRHLQSEIDLRRRIAATYDTELREAVHTPVVRAGCEHAYHLYVARTAARDSLRKALEADGIGSGIHYPVPVHLQPAYAGRVAAGAGGMGVTEALAREIVSLPMHPFLTQDEVKAVTASVRKWRSETRAA
jgi:dTDP-4-amino-4,6-dideoxygalactose transaminase